MPSGRIRVIKVGDRPIQLLLPDGQDLVALIPVKAMEIQYVESAAGAEMLLTIKTPIPSFTVSGEQYTDACAGSHEPGPGGRCLDAEGRRL